MGLLLSTDSPNTISVRALRPWRSVRLGQKHGAYPDDIEWFLLQLCTERHVLPFTAESPSTTQEHAQACFGIVPVVPGIVQFTDTCWLIQEDIARLFGGSADGRMDFSRTSRLLRKGRQPAHRAENGYVSCWVPPALGGTPSWF